MSGIFSSIATASFALQTHSRSVEQAGKNIANLNNPNYARQRVVTGSIGVTTTSTGQESGPLVALGVEQIRDKFLDRQILNEVSYRSTLETQDFRLQQMLSTLGENIDRLNDPQFIAEVTYDGGGLRGSVDNFFNAFESFSARPNDPTTKQVLIQAAQNMTDSFNRIDARLARIDENLGAEIEAEVASLNTRLTELADINRQIARLEVGRPGSANDLRDLRQAKLEEISEFLLVEVNEPANALGQITIDIRAQNGDQQRLLDIGLEPAELFYNEATGTYRLVGSSAELDLQAGRLPALVDLKNNSLAAIRSDIDQLANAVATSVNELYYQAYQPESAPGAGDGVAEISFFQQPTPPPSQSGIASTVTAASIALYTAPSDPSIADYVALEAQTLRSSTTGLAGANDLASAIAALADTSQALLGGNKFADFATRTVIGIGQDILDINNRLDVQRGVQDILKERRAEISGVSMDEEVANMVQYQRAFQASSRVFATLSEMLEVIVTGLR